MVGPLCFAVKLLRRIHCYRIHNNYFQFAIISSFSAMSLWYLVCQKYDLRASKAPQLPSPSTLRNRIHWDLNKHHSTSLINCNVIISSVILQAFSELNVTLSLKPADSSSLGNIQWYFISDRGGAEQNQQSVPYHTGTFLAMP